MLADSEGDVASGIAPHAADRTLRGWSAVFGRLEIALALERGAGGWIQIRRAADDIQNPLRESIQRLATGGARWFTLAK